jgi:hypothetical protein
MRQHDQRADGGVLSTLMRFIRREWHSVVLTGGIFLLIPVFAA